MFSHLLLIEWKFFGSYSQTKCHSEGYCKQSTVSFPHSPHSSPSLLPLTPSLLLPHLLTPHFPLTPPHFPLTPPHFSLTPPHSHILSLLPSLHSHLTPFLLLLLHISRFSTTIAMVSRVIPDIYYTARRNLVSDSNYP